MTTFKRFSTTGLHEDLRAGRSLLLLGPRQTGKSTLLKEVIKSFPTVLEYPLQIPSVRTRLSLDPEIVLREAQGGKSPPIVFVDEIQKVPELLDVLQYLLDDKKIILAATGSSARKLRHGAVNWLPGRIHLRHLYPLTWEERGILSSTGGNETLLEERLLFGGLPGILAEANTATRQSLLSTYATLYLEEEIRQESAVRRLPPFAKFLQLAALESGQSPNLSKIASQVGVSHPTVGQYFDILEESLILHRIPSFGMNRSDVLRKPRYYFFDTGVRNAAAGLEHSRGLLTLQAGPLFEQACVLELLATAPPGTKLSYWRTKRGDEVDIVLEKAGRTVPVEIKWTDTPRPEDFDGLKTFASQEKTKHAFLICRIPHPQKFNHGLALPWARMKDVWKSLTDE